MIDPNADDATKIMEVRRIFDETHGHFEDYDRHALEDLEFESGEQWSAEDKAYLAQQMRPTLTFNLVQPIIDHQIGTLEDQKKAPRVVAVSRNDRFTADILNDLYDRVRYEIDLSMNEMETAYWAAITGIGGIALDTIRDEDDYVLITATPLPYNEFRFDPWAAKPDLSDADYMVRSRWFTESEFKRSYPAFADDWDRLMATVSDMPTLGQQAQPRSPINEPDYPPITDWGIDRTKHQLRVIHLEYRVTTAVSEDEPAPTSRRRRVQAVDAEAQEGDTRKVSGERTTTQIRTIEMVGPDTILYDDVTPLPILGFSVIPFPWRKDRRTRTFQGKVRGLIDPQREINKRFSQEVHLINSMAQPGTDIEEGATNLTVEEFERRGKTPGGVRLLAPGRIESVRDRPMPQMPEAIGRMHDQAIQLIRIVSNTTMDTLLEPRGVPEAAATAQLRHRQSTLAMVPVIKNYQSFQKTITKRIIEIVVNSFGDAQLEDMLSNSDVFTVNGGVITEAQRDPESQEPQRQATFGDVRELRYNVELVTTAESENSNQLIQLQFLDTAKEREIPIAPDVYIDLLPLPRDMKDRLKEHATMQAKMALQLQQADVAQKQQTIAQLTEADRAKNIVDLKRIEEERRHNFAAEITQAVKVGFEHQRGMAEIVEGASAEQLAFIGEIIKFIGAAQQGQADRDAAASEPAQPTQ